MNSIKEYLAAAKLIGAYPEAIAWFEDLIEGRTPQGLLNPEWLRWAWRHKYLPEIFRPALEVYEVAVKSAEEVYDVSVKPALEVYEVAVKSALEVYEAAVKPARETLDGEVRRIAGGF